MIYLVEDDHSIRELVLYTLNNYGMEATGFENGEQFRSALKTCTPDLVMLDIMLPGEDGISILKKLRSDKATADLPVMFLTAKSTEYDKVIGLDNGADDYVTKPFGMMELIARIKALLRRAGSNHPQKQEYVHGKLTVNTENHTVTVDGQLVNTTRKEFDLLCLLIQNPHKAFDRDQLLEQVWGYSFDGENRTVDVHIRTLRQKLGDYAHYIETVRSVGYKIGGLDQ